MSQHQSSGQSEEYYAALREKMVAEQIAARYISDPVVLAAMNRVPRHLFVPRQHRHLAYHDGALPISNHQTISQPYIVGLMTELLRPRPGDTILEIGVGSGYQTAILAEIVGQVIGIERIPALAEAAADLLAALGYHNVTILTGDGTKGHPAHAPYQRIIAAAASPSIPRPLVEQLAEGGHLVIPIGSPGSDQILERITRRGGSIHIERLTPVRFVPMIGEHGR